jgi:uroporphyrinogen decarboxylase
MQVASGARSIQVFDSWVGALAADDYVRFAQPYSRALIERIKSAGVPVIHFGTGASGYFKELHAAGGDVMGCDWRINIDQAWMDISYRSAIMGNLDPVALLLRFPNCGPRSTICCGAPERGRATSSTWATAFCPKRRWRT